MLVSAGAQEIQRATILVRARLHEVLIDAASDPVAREAMLQFFGTTRFLPIDGDTSAVLDDLRRGVARVRAEAE